MIIVVATDVPFGEEYYMIDSVVIHTVTNPDVADVVRAAYSALPGTVMQYWDIYGANLDSTCYPNLAAMSCHLRHKMEVLGKRVAEPVDMHQ